jgi:hypothetical protein
MYLERLRDLMATHQIKLTIMIIQHLIYLSDDLAAQRRIAKLAGVRERNRKHI